MLMVKLIAQTGNNMFQYAASRTLAQRKGYEFCYRGGRKGTLARDFVLGGESPLKVALKRFRFALTAPGRMKKFKNSRRRFTESIEGETYDPAFFDLRDGTLVRGFFQSEEYFGGNRQQVLQWFTPKARYLRQLESIASSIPVPVEQRCCIHIRRSDYFDMDRKKDGLGWVLPLEYYRRAKRLLPPDLFFVIVSDDPDFAESVFEDVPNKLVARNNPAVVDMFLFTRCRYNIIANSSFSWWGAWLNETPGRVVIAPRYHLGWTEGIWFPERIRVDSWRYVDVVPDLPVGEAGLKGAGAAVL